MGALDEYYQKGSTPSGGALGDLYTTYKPAPTIESTAPAPAKSGGWGGVFKGIARGVGNVAAGLVSGPIVGAGEVFNRDINAPVQATLQSGGQLLTGKKATWGKNYDQAANALTSSTVMAPKLLDKAAGTHVDEAVQSAYDHPKQTAAYTALTALGPLAKTLGTAGKVGEAAVGAGFGAKAISQVPSEIKGVQQAQGSDKVTAGTEAALNTVLGVLGLTGAVHGTKGALNEAIGRYDGLRAGATLGELDKHDVKEPLALPPGKEVAGLPARSATNPLKETPGGAVFGDFHPVSDDTKAQMSKLNSVIDSYHSKGATTDDVGYLNHLTSMRDQAAKTVDSLAKDRADMLRGSHADGGGVSLIKGDDGMVTKRVSSNDPFYSQYYKENGRPPTKAAWLEEAHKQLLTGKDEMAKEYQAAAGVAHTAHQELTQKLQEHKSSDIYRQPIAKEQADLASAELGRVKAKAGQERLGIFEQPKPATPALSADDTMAKLHSATQEGANAPARIGLINEAIQHPDITPEVKAKLIQERDALLPSNKNALPPGSTEPSKQIVQPESKQASTKTAQAVAQDIRPESTPVEPKAQTTKPTPEAKVLTPSPSSKRGAFNEVFSKVTKGVSDKVGAALNPFVQLSAKHPDAANLLKDWFGEDNLNVRRGAQARQEIEALAGKDINGVRHHVEGTGTVSENAAKAAEAVNKHTAGLGKEAERLNVIKEQRGNYFPRVLKKTGDLLTGGGSGGGVSKTTKFAQSRALDENGNVIHKTFDEAQAAVGKKNAQFEEHAGKVVQALYNGEGKANVNAHFQQKMLDTPMADGRPMRATGNEGKYKDYQNVNNLWIHPEAAEAVKSLTKTGSDSALGNALQKTVSTEKKATMALPFAHAVHIAENNQQLHPFTPLINLVTSSVKGAKIFKDNPALVDDMVKAGANFFRYKNSMVDGLSNESAKWNLLGRAHDVESKALFHGLIDNIMAENINKVYQRGLKAGLGEKEAMQSATQLVNKVAGSNEAFTSSHAARQAGQVGSFAYEWTVSNPKQLTQALGVNVDRSMSPQAQRFQRNQAARLLATGFASTFVIANALNMATLGRPVWQNDPHHLLDPGYKDKDGKVTYFNIYGGIGDIMHWVTNPTQTAYNKVSPLFRVGMAVGGNRDPFSGNHITQEYQNGLQKLVSQVKYVVANAYTPLGVGAGAKDAVVRGAQIAGFGGSSSASPTYSAVNDLKQEQSSTQAQVASLIKAGKTQEAQKLADSFNSKVTQVGNDLAKSPDASPEAKKLLLNLNKEINANTYKPSDKPAGPKDALAGLLKNINSGSDPATQEAGFNQAKENKQTLSFMQDQKLNGSHKFDSFFAAHPELDVSQGGKVADNNKSQESAAIITGLAKAKANHQTLQYMQSIKQSGNGTFDKFFTAHPNLDPTSKNFQPKSKSSFFRSSAGRGGRVKVSKSTIKLTKPVARVSLKGLTSKRSKLSLKP